MSRFDDESHNAMHRDLHTVPLPLALRHRSAIFAGQHEMVRREAWALLSIIAIVAALAALAIGG